MPHIIRYNGEGEPDLKLLKEVLKKNKITILDSEQLPKMALVNGISDSLLPILKTQLPGWLISAQDHTFKIPNTRRKTR